MVLDTLINRLKIYEGHDYECYFDSQWDALIITSEGVEVDAIDINELEL